MNDLEYQRYAIYFAPRAGSELAEFGKKWLGVDAEAKLVYDPPSAYVATPRRYGFHATLKAPIRLRIPYDYAEFRNAVASLSRELKRTEMGVLKLRRFGTFLALTLDDDFRPRVADLAWKCVTHLDIFRADLNDAERTKRGSLSKKERDNLERWGYPYVHNCFRFHMTLTSALEQSELKTALMMLNDAVPEAPTSLDSICIFGDPGRLRPFELVERFDLTD